MFYKDETLAIFVDGPSLHQSARALDFAVDYGRLLHLFQSRARLIRAIYATPVFEADDHVAMRPLLDYLAFNGWSVIEKPTRAEADQPHRRVGIEVELAVAAAKMAGRLDHAVIFTGNRDFAPLVAFMQDSRARVTIASTLRSEPPACADLLRRQADAFLDIADLRDAIARPARGEAA